jgi:hypothetical protein
VPQFTPGIFALLHTAIYDEVASITTPTTPTPPAWWRHAPPSRGASRL